MDRETQERIWDLERAVTRRDDMLSDLKKRLTPAEDAAARVPFLEKQIQTWERARSASAIPEPGPTARDEGFEKGLRVAIRLAKKHDASAPLIAALEEAAGEWEGDFHEE